MGAEARALTNEELLASLVSLDTKLMTAQWLAEGTANRLAEGRSQTVCHEAVRLLGTLRAVLKHESGNVVAEMNERDR